MSHIYIWRSVSYFFRELGLNIMITSDASRGRICGTARCRCTYNKTQQQNNHKMDYEGNARHSVCIYMTTGNISGVSIYVSPGTRRSFETFDTYQHDGVRFQKNTQTHTIASPNRQMQHTYFHVNSTHSFVILLLGCLINRPTVEADGWCFPKSHHDQMAAVLCLLVFFLL